jgi:maltokinase
MPTPRGQAWIYDALADPELTKVFVERIAGDLDVRSIRQSLSDRANTSLVLDDTHLVKVFRQIHQGPNPDVEVAEALGRVGFSNVPIPLNVWRRGGADLAVVRRFRHARGVGAELAKDSLRELFNLQRPPRECKLDFAPSALDLGRSIASMHVALAEAFGVEDPVGAAWAADMIANLRRVSGPRLDTAKIESVYRRLEMAEDLGASIRIHGDLHLGQVLRLKREWLILDFEGRPDLPIEERRHTLSPLRDVAAMVRSFHDVAAEALREVTVPDAGTRVLAESWTARSVNSFLSGYAEVDEGHRLLPATRASRDALLRVFELDIAVVGLAYEQAHHPELVDLPFATVEKLLADPDPGA